MLKRPTRPLPRRFSRPLTPQMRSFVERRHKRVKTRKQERWKRAARRLKSAVAERVEAWRRWVLLGVALLILASGGVLLFSPIMSVREIRVVRTEGRVDVRRVMEELAPIYGRHLVFLPHQEVTAKVRAAVPDLAEVEVRKHYPSQLSIRIELKPLAARLLIEQPGAPKTGTGAVAPAAGSGAVAPRRYDFLTANGMYVATEGKQAELQLPTIRVVDWGVRPVPNTPLVAPELLDAMRQAEQALTREFGQEVRMRTVYLRAREFHLDTAKVSFWFDIRSPLEAQLGRLRSFLKSVKLQDVKSYVDLRLAGKVVYR